MELNENHLPTVSPFFPENESGFPLERHFPPVKIAVYRAAQSKWNRKRKRFTPFDELIRRVIYDWPFDEAQQTAKQTNGRYQPHKPPLCSLL
jgi:hypothetical protein